jgi:MerR family transcriptional regulator, light-induced transcriptional regulator
MAQYSIKDLERLSGIKAHTLRIWEKRYRLVEPQRTSTNIRAYSDEDLKRILNVSILNRNGVKISHIASLSDQDIHERITIITRDSNDHESLIENLIIAMIDLDQEGIENIFSRAILQVGFEEFILKVIYPFLDKIGILWQIGTINPAQEHFVSNMIRQKMIVGIDSLIPAINNNPKHFLLFLPEGELHELGLLFYCYLLQKRGHKVTYLGQWVPIRDMISASSVLDYDYLLNSVVSIFSGEKLLDYLNKLSASFSNKTIFVTGLQVESITSPLPSNIVILRKGDDIFNHIS